MRQHQPLRDKAHVDDDRACALAECLGRQRARVEALKRADARVRCEARIELGAADVDGDDLRRATREQDVGEASGRSADIEADEARWIEREGVERRGELDPPRDAQGCSASASIGASPATSSEAFLSATPPTLTRPAAIAACARALLGKKPRSTRTISARLRMGPLTKTAEFIVNDNPNGDRTSLGGTKAGRTRCVRGLAVEPFFGRWR